MKVLVLSGSGRYQDAWHDFTATSLEVARALEPVGAEVVVRSSQPRALAELPHADLLVVNAGAGRYSEVADGPADAWADAFAALDAYRVGGGPVLALHAAAMTLTDLDAWPGWIGGRWDPAVSMHPPIGAAEVRVSDGDHPVTRGLGDFTLHDERYSYLTVDPAARVLLDHEHDGRAHALVWALERDGGRAVYDALGHDVAAYASAPRVDLLRREVAWLVGDR